MHIVSNGDNLHEMSNPVFWETICMKCQILFSGKNKKKYFNMSSAENFTQCAKCLLIQA